MTVTHQVYALLAAVSSLGFLCKADPLPPVSEISFEWLNGFFLKVSWTWERPVDLPPSCEVEYYVYRPTTAAFSTTGPHRKTILQQDVDRYLTEEAGSGRWDIDVQVVGVPPCDNWKSKNTSKTVTTKKPRGELVEDFKCVTDPDGMNCSWIPLDPDLNVTLSYGSCEESEENMTSLKKCDERYVDGKRNGCYLRDEDACVLIETESELKTFEAALVIRLPKMSIREDGDHLRLTWTSPDVGTACVWEYEVCYTECEIPRNCLTTHMDATEDGSLKILYDDRCRYEFKYKVKTSRYCIEVPSDGSGSMTYVPQGKGPAPSSDPGGNTPPVLSLSSTIVIASVLSVVLSVCLVLTCYCFKRHRDIFCPSIPDPSAIFKGMMVNGNKDLMPSTSSHLYTPMPEAVECCKLILVAENSTVQENS
ncbi:uncharacterized protein LOC115385196 [Salarias fasciatus]|uniref:Uncharacterized LOC115385196 n=1 Tax=Salarias fasciatus TaxID=181472 RepID=A0A672G2X6_SALFA|nr:uncharacterized protein LOC115385196 [Salarias fasciatus]